MRSADTSPESHAVQIAIYRRLGSARRVEIAAGLSAETRELTRAGVRSRHPEYSDADVDLACRRVWLGDDLFCRAWPASPLVLP